MERLLPIILLLATAFGAADARAQAADEGGRYSGMAGAGVALLGERRGALNPATLGGLETPALALHGSQAFGISELRHGSAAVAWPIARVTPALTLRTFGFDAFRTTTISVAAAARLTDIGGSLYGGLAIERHHVAIKGYGSRSVTALSGGWILSLLPGLHVGGSAHNILAARWAAEDELPQVLRVGASYRNSGAVVVLDIAKDVRFPISGAAGVEYEIIDVLRLRMGAATEPTRVALGAGFILRYAEVDIAAERHHVLGWTPALSLSMHL